MLIGEQILLSQIGMNRRKNSFITTGGRRGLDMSDQLRSIFITGLGKMHLVSSPERAAFLAISRVEVVRGGDKLSRGKKRLLPPSPSLLEGFTLLLPDALQGGNSRQRFHPRGSRSSIQPSAPT